MFLASVLAYKETTLTPIQFIFAIVSIPILMTLAEAKALHTWDTPVLFFTAGISLIGILQI